MALTSEIIKIIKIIINRFNFLFLSFSDKNECLEPTTCKNGATCQDLDGDFNCICTPGYEGKDCGNGKT